MKTGVHDNRKSPFTYNGETDVATFSQVFLIQSFLYLHVTKTCIKSRTISNFGQIGPLTTELAALEHLKKSHTYGGKMVSPCYIFNRTIIKVAGNQDMHKSLGIVDFGPLVSKAKLTLLRYPRRHVFPIN